MVISLGVCLLLVYEWRGDDVSIDRNSKKLIGRFMPRPDTADAMPDDPATCAKRGTVIATLLAPNSLPTILPLARSVVTAGYRCLVVQPFELAQGFFINRVGSDQRFRAGVRRRRAPLLGLVLFI